MQNGTKNENASKAMIVPIDAERLDLPSASDAHARRRCLGRTQLIRHLKQTGKLTPEVLEQGRSADGRYASFGLRIHAAWAGQKIELSGFESETLEKLIRLEAMLVADWAGHAQVALFKREERIWLHQGITPLHSGRYDVAYVSLPNFERMLIIDGKTLFDPVAPADTNDQLRELVALGRYNYPAVKEFSVAIIQPNVDRPVSLASYDALEAELALRLLRWHLNDINGIDLPRIYGEWCKFCPAMQFCPEAKAAIEPVLACHFDRDLEGKLTLTIGEEGADFVRRLIRAKSICESMLAAYKEYLSQNPDDIPGFRLKAGRQRREIKDSQAAFNALAEFINSEEFVKCATLSVTKLEALYGVATGMKGKALWNKFNAQLADSIEWKTDAPQLEDTQTS